MVQYLRGEIAKLANVNIETLRYYEKHGLLPAPSRSASGYRLYTEDVLKRLTFIQNAKSCGFTLKEIKKALIQSADGSINITDFMAVIDRKIISIDLEIAKREQTKHRLTELKSGLQKAKKHSGVQETLQMLNME
ncbi:MerR family transcriptional regulator [Paenibacillus sp. 19GGS1-52]|uniref:MerR family transcriptional regulator n=1 Tax=Paenibacillus sp. 19GGS1-52 TaxID=2758563 RepID=UPI0023BAB054|nr:MerR family transcriptional regulator [Paenibacillus sp. 19GGS1-52]ULO10417.1 MerR family transcriptional regulator [Paenibacillus sp. 19GGS1-52]